MWIRRTSYFLVALGFAIAALWYYEWSGRDPFKCADATQFLPPESTELLVMPHPFRLLSQLENQKAYLQLHEALPWAFAIVDPIKYDQVSHMWFEENPLYFFIVDNQPGMAFGLPAGWSKQVQEQWLVGTLNARPLQSGLFSIAMGDPSNLLFLRVKNNICKVSKSREVNFSQETEVDEAKRSDVNKAINMGGNADLIHILRNGLHTESGIPFLPGTGVDLTVRDLYLHNQHLIGEEVIFTETSSELATPLPSSWQRFIPEKVTSFRGLGAESGYQLVESQNKIRSAERKLAAWNGEMAELETQLNTGAESTLGGWWNHGLAQFEAFGNRYEIMGTADMSATLNGLNFSEEVVLEPLLSGQLLEWESHPLLTHLMEGISNMTYKVAWVNSQTVIFAENRSAMLKLVSRVGSGQVIDDGHALARALQRGERFIEYRQISHDGFTSIQNMTLPSYQVEDKEQVTHYLRSGSEGGRGKIVTRFDLSPASSAVPPASIIWETSLPSLNPKSITSVKNHSNGEYYTLIQDLEYTLHALDARGRKMWTYALSAKIEGEIVSIDILKNDKLQVAFATENGVYCVDVLGRDVPGFPIRPQGANTFSSPLLITDYEQTRNYRFLIGQSDGKVLNFSSDAKSTSGWKTPQFKAEPVYLAYLKCGSKDYLFTLLSNGKTDLLQRNGAQRHKTALKLPPFNGVPFFRITGSISTSSILVADTSGNIVEGSFGNGQAPQLATIASGTYMSLADLNRDRHQDLVVLSGNTISVHGANGALLFKRTLRSEVMKDLRVYQFSTGLRLGVVLPALGELHLLTPDGSDADGFPIFGSGPCAIRDFTNDGKLELVTTDGKGLVICYRL